MAHAHSYIGLNNNELANVTADTFKDLPALRHVPRPIAIYVVVGLTCVSVHAYMCMIH